MKESITKASVLATLAPLGSTAVAAPQVSIPLGAANSVQVVDAATTLAVATIKDVPQVHGLAATPDGRYLVAGSFTEVSAPTGKMTAKELGPAPYHVPAIRGTGTLYVSSRAEPRIWVVDQDTLELRDEFAIPGIGHQMVLASN